MPVLIAHVVPRSPGGRAGIQAGDTLLSINGHEITDVLDYRFYMTSSVLQLSLMRGGKAFSKRIHKGEYDDLGLEFETYLMDKQIACKNKCIFCFVDQMPPGMRESLYFKDDDSRLSFLFGNYITLTNLSEKDIDRIIQMRISPVNVSVHTTDPELRVRMMKNPAAASSLGYLERLVQAGIHVNAQLVLVPGWNDGAALEKTLQDLGQLGPNLQSIACVPVGLTRYREGLPELQPFERQGALDTIAIIHRFAENMLAERGSRIARPADEFFLKAGIEPPPSDYYGDFDQLEDGLGLFSMVRDDFLAALEDDEGTPVPKMVQSVVTGMAAYPLISRLAERAMKKHPSVQIHVYPIRNTFFGEQITVAGLVTAQDILCQLAGADLGERLLFPSVMLRREKDRFLDNMTLDDLSHALGIPMLPIDNDGWELYEAMIHGDTGNPT